VIDTFLEKSFACTVYVDFCHILCDFVGDAECLVTGDRFNLVTDTTDTNSECIYVNVSIFLSYWLFENENDVQTCHMLLRVVLQCLQYDDVL